MTKAARQAVLAERTAAVKYLQRKAAEALTSATQDTLRAAALSIAAGEHVELGDDL